MTVLQTWLCRLAEQKDVSVSMVPMGTLQKRLKRLPKRPEDSRCSWEGGYIWGVRRVRAMKRN